MKKLLAFILLMLSCSTVTAFASEMGESDISQFALFASEETYTSIIQKRDDEQIERFFDGEVDMQYLVPVYIPTRNSSDDTLQSMLEFTNTYNTMVYSQNGEVLGTATLEFYEDKWVVGTFYEGYNMLEKIGTIPADSNQTFYYIDNPYKNEQTLLIVGQNTETYRSLTNPKGTVDVGEIVNEINEIQRLNNILDNGTDVNTDNTALILYIIASCTIIAFVIAVSIFIYRKKQGNNRGDRSALIK